MDCLLIHVFHGYPRGADGLKWYKRLGIKLYIYGKLILFSIWFVCWGMWRVPKTDEEIEKQKKADDELLKEYKRIKQIKIWKLLE